jgi:hypothetical protein
MHLSAAFPMLLAACLAGCASLRPGPESTPTRPAAAPPEAMGWWAARYPIAEPDPASPRWHLDLLIAERVVAPVLAAHRPEIPLWRWHRRAGRDATGHRFTFLFYASAGTAQRVLAELRADCTLQALREAGTVGEPVYSDPHAPDMPRVQDGGDRSWSPLMREHWPHYIMGVSELWLRLLSSLSQDAGPPPACAPPPVLDPHYRRVSEALDAVWKAEGGHALLHHLNAVFGYQPVQVIERRLLTF